VHHAAIAPIWIGVSRRCAQGLRSRTGSLGVRVHELYYPVDIPLTIRTPANAGPLRLAYVGRLEESQKRVSRLVSLFSELTRRKVDFCASVAGDGPASANFAMLLTAAGSEVSRRVEIQGSLDRRNLDALLATHDIILLVSAYEGLPLALRVCARW
jgi:glycosyltransferase involved in cell wall biosynthesis